MASSCVQAEMASDAPAVRVAWLILQHISFFSIGGVLVISIVKVSAALTSRFRVCCRIDMRGSQRARSPPIQTLRWKAALCTYGVTSFLSAMSIVHSLPLKLWDAVHCWRMFNSQSFKKVIVGRSFAHVLVGANSFLLSSIILHQWFTSLVYLSLGRGITAVQQSAKEKSLRVRGALSALGSSC